MAKGKNGLSLLDTWEKLFIENEGRAKKMTDAQLVAAMEKEFPDKKGKSTVTRVRMFRSAYNNAAHSMKGRDLPSARSKTRPISHEYDAKGNVVEPRRGGGAPKEGGVAEKKRGGKKKGGKAAAVADPERVKIETMSRKRAERLGELEDVGVEDTLASATEKARAIEGRVVVLRGANKFTICKVHQPANPKEVKAAASARAKLSKKKAGKKVAKKTAKKGARARAAEIASGDGDETPPHRRKARRKAASE